MRCAVIQSWIALLPRSVSIFFFGVPPAGSMYLLILFHFHSLDFYATLSHYEFWA